MQILDVQGEKREARGRHANERLRRRGMIPAVIYGHKQAPENIALSRHDVELAISRLQHVVNLKDGGGSTTYLIKEVQYDHLHKDPIHVDLMRVDPNERVHVRVPVIIRGEAKGVHDGGEVVQAITDLDVECRLLAIPEEVRVKIDDLLIGQSITVKDLDLPEGVTAQHEPDEAVVLCRARRGVTEAAPEAAAEGATAEPEVIGRVAKEREEGEEK